MEDDLEQEVAELVCEGRRRPGSERVVDLVRLLEEMIAERLVGLLAVPRAAVGQPQPGGDPGHRPGTRDGELRRDRAEIQGCREVVGRQVADTPGLGRPEASDRVISRVQAPEQEDRIPTRGTVPARQRLRRRVRGGPEGGQRNDEDGPPGFKRRRDEPLGGDDLQARGEVEPPAEPRFGDERVEHPFAASSVRGRRGARG